jgi:LuxR family maltose regulon positive regulatory protein
MDKATYQDELVVRTKLIPPRPRRSTLHRPRLTALLSRALDYRLTVVHAGTGYGKSTALASLLTDDISICWYSISKEDTDPLIFLLHLIYAFRALIPEISSAPSAILERHSDRLALSTTTASERGPTVWNAAIDSLVNALMDTLHSPCVLVLDDFHLVSEAPTIATIVDRLVTYSPQNLSVTLSCRYPPSLPGLVTWRARNELLEVGYQELAFTADEVASLFREQYNYDLAPDDARALTAKTEGWIIAIQLIWQAFQTSDLPNIPSELARLPDRDSLAAAESHRYFNALFAFLAKEVLEKQPDDVQAFMLDTSILRQLTPEACNTLREVNDSDLFLSYLDNRDLFIIELGENQSRYHHLFRDFLQSQLSPERASDLHQCAVDYFRSIGNDEEAIYHLLATAAHATAAALLNELGRTMVRQGRLETLAGWIGQLPPDVLEANPALLSRMGDIARLRSRFDEALGWYSRAEACWRDRGDRLGTSRTLQSQALVYLDTVQPARAESLLAEALQLSDGQEDRRNRAGLLELLAENQLNLGHPTEAERLRVEARQLREEGPSEGQLGVRVLLRTGQLNRARGILESQVTDEEVLRQLPQTPGRAHHSHREAQLLLSLIYAFLGEADAAFRAAEAGMMIGRRLGSPLVTAIGYMRMGHSWLIRSVPDAHFRAIECFNQAIALGDAVAVQRTRVEAQWGLCRAFGFHGDLAAAEDAAEIGVEIGQRAGDTWTVAMTRLTLGASYVLAGRHSEATRILAQVAVAFRDCSDTYGHAAAHLWLGLAYLRLDRCGRMAEIVETLLDLTEQYGYQHLFTHPALLGPPENRILVPMLLEARRRKIRPATVSMLLRRMGLAGIEFHPGYCLRVQALGPFRVWRGAEKVDDREWRRSKALHLFQLLLTNRERMLEKEEIIDALWPDVGLDIGPRNLKIALYALNKALEPDRAAGVESAYIARQGSAYGIRHPADVCLDIDEFEQAIRSGSNGEGESEGNCAALQRALDLYLGDYLQDSLYEDWASGERERLLALYLRTAEKLAAMRLKQGRYDDTVALCRRILTRDSCWERAYRLMMAACALQGNRSRALRIYQDCKQTTIDELAAEPGPLTRKLHEQISTGVPVGDWVI